MPARKVISDHQLEILVSAMDADRELALGVYSNSNNSIGFRDVSLRWMKLAEKMNQASDAEITKDGTGWRKYWNEAKYKVKKKASIFYKNARRTEGPSRASPLTEIEEQILGIIGRVAVFMPSKKNAQINNNAVSTTTVRRPKTTSGCTTLTRPKTTYRPRLPFITNLPQSTVVMEDRLVQLKRERLEVARESLEVARESLEVARQTKDSLDSIFCAVTTLNDNIVALMEMSKCGPTTTESSSVPSPEPLTLKTIETVPS